MSLDSFELYLERGGRKKTTVAGHVSNLKRLLKENEHCLDSIEELESTLLSLRRKGLKNISLNRLVIAVKLYSTFCGREDLHSVQWFKEEPSVKSTLSDEELESLIDLPRIKNTPKGIWDQMTLFFAVLCFSGGRPGEVAKLTVDTVDFGSNTLAFLDTKTHDNRYVPIHPILLEKYKLREFVGRSRGYLFPSSRGGLNGDGLPILSQAEWNRNFRKRLDALGIVRKGVSTYSCRHSYITRMIDADVNIFKIQRIVGHKKIETTAIYTHLSSKQDQQTVQSDPLGLRAVSPKKALSRMRELIEPIVARDDRFSWVYSDTEILIKLK